MKQIEIEIRGTTPLLIQRWGGVWERFVNGGKCMKQIQVEIRGITPLLIHRFSEQSEQQASSRRTLVKRVDPRVEATSNAYIAGDGTYYFSAFSIPGCMTNAGANHKMRGSRKTLRFVVPSAVRMDCDSITILNGDGPAKNFEVDSRPVTIPSTKGRVMRHRPRFDDWSAKFRINLDDDQLDESTAQQLLEEAGRSIGVGDFRPEKRGPFGTFRVVSWQSS
jgi:hypothetical protein